MAQLPPHPDHLLTAAEEDKAKQVPSDPEHINPKLTSDIAYWSGHFHVSGPLLHEAIRTHGTSVQKLRTALQHHEVNLT